MSRKIKCSSITGLIYFNLNIKLFIFKSVLMMLEFMIAIITKYVRHNIVIKPVAWNFCLPLLVLKITIFKIFYGTWVQIHAHIYFRRADLKPVFRAF